MKLKLASSCTWRLGTPVAKPKSKSSRVFTVGNEASFTRIARERAWRLASSVFKSCSRKSLKLSPFVAAASAMAGYCTPTAGSFNVSQSAVSRSCCRFIGPPP